MKVIILAAGEGKRLRPLTEDLPKCLVSLFGKSILERQIEILKSVDLTDIIIVRGYNAHKITIPNVSFYQNDRFDETNMVETLFCARKELKDSVIVSYGDIIYEKRIIEKLKKSNEDFSVIVDEGWEDYWKIRFKNPLEDAESLIFDEHGYVTSIGQPVENIENIQGQYIGLMKFQGKALEEIRRFYDEVKKKAHHGKNPLNPKIPFEKSYMTDFLQGLINRGMKIKAIPIRHGWIELDSLNDYNTYNKLHKEGLLKKFILI